MSLFDEYYSEYTDLVNHVGSLTAELLAANPFSSEAHAALGVSIEQALSEATDVVKQMEIHGRSLKKPKNRELILDRAKGYHKTLIGLRGEYEAAKQQHEREMLFCQQDDDDFDDEEGGGRGGQGRQQTNRELSDSDKGRLMATSDALGRSSDSLQRSMSALAETEAIGGDIVAELARGREKIESASSRVRSVDAMANKARRAIRHMNMREVRNQQWSLEWCSNTHSGI